MRLARVRMDDITPGHPAYKPGRVGVTPDWL
jgi:hypothetical protein